MTYIVAMTQRARSGRASLPLIERDAEPTIVITNEDIEEAADADDIERHAPEQTAPDTGDLGNEPAWRRRRSSV